MSGANSKKEIVPVVGRGGRPQMQPTSRRSWTQEKEQEFLSVLGETCNVTRACASVGMSSRGAYKRRQKNAAFRAAWLETIAMAYERLELVLLERSFNGTEKVIRRHDGTEERMREYPNRIGLSLLKMHRDAVQQWHNQASSQADDVEEIREQLIKKLLRLKERRERE
jgi:hypothetical protein